MWVLWYTERVGARAKTAKVTNVISITAKLVIQVYIICYGFYSLILEPTPLIADWCSLPFFKGKERRCIHPLDAILLTVSIHLPQVLIQKISQLGWWGKLHQYVKWGQKVSPRDTEMGNQPGPLGELLHHRRGCLRQCCLRFSWSSGFYLARCLANVINPH